MQVPHYNIFSWSDHIILLTNKYIQYYTRILNVSTSYNMIFLIEQTIIHKIWERYDMELQWAVVILNNVKQTQKHQDLSKAN